MNRTRTEMNPGLFPDEIRPYLLNADVYDSSCSEEARVWYIDRDGGLFLKRYAAGKLKDESVMTAYYHSLGLSAEVLSYVTTENHDFLLTRRIPGEDCTHEMYRAEPERLCEVMAVQLRKLHEIQADDCPVQDRLDTYKALVLSGHDRGKYEPELFRGLWEFPSAEEAWKCAERGLHLLKKEVLIHGDYCLPNILLDQWRFSGFIDVGAGGISDRHVDLLWGIWTLAFNLGTTRYSERFMDAYGRDRIDPGLLRCVAAMEMVGEY